jgi:hypothetical protein
MKFFTVIYFMFAVHLLIRPLFEERRKYIMDLNLPIFDQLTNCQNLLIAGMCGGFELFCGLPIYFELREQGYYGNHHLTEKTRGSRLWISPLMPIYWFFDLPTVAHQNLYLSHLGDTETFMDALQRYMLCSGTFQRGQMPEYLYKD